MSAAPLIFISAPIFACDAFSFNVIFATFSAAFSALPISIPFTAYDAFSASNALLNVIYTLSPLFGIPEPSLLTAIAFVTSSFVYSPKLPPSSFVISAIVSSVDTLLNPLNVTSVPTVIDAPSPNVTFTTF